MSPRPIPDFTANERQLVAQTLRERYGQPVEAQTADAELCLDPEGKELTTRPSLFWEERGAHFVIFKMGEAQFRCQFYYSDTEQFGTGHEIYDNVGDCVVDLLQVQSDHERTLAGVRSGMTAVDFDKLGDGDDYFPPLIV